MAASGTLLAWVHPIALGSWAVSPQLAPVLRDAPATVESGISLQAEATARPLSPALVKKGCRHRGLLMEQAVAEKQGALGPPDLPQQCQLCPRSMLLRPIPSLTSEAGRLINGEISIPDHREVQFSITKLITFIEILRKMEPHKHKEDKQNPCPTWESLVKRLRRTFQGQPEVSRSVSWALTKNQKQTNKNIPGWPTGDLTEAFWHCTLLLLKRTAGTRCCRPCTRTTHS